MQFYNILFHKYSSMCVRFKLELTCMYLHRLYNLKIWNSLEIGMFWVVEVLLRHCNTLFKEVFVYLNPVFLGNQHPTKGKQSL